jgi:TetR/AcrR family transcriptional regulator
MVTARAAEIDVRASVLQAATRLFAAHGFDGTAIQDVADAVGVSKPAVLHHFASKEVLRLSVLDAILEHWRGKLPRLLVAATASEARFDAVFGELHRFFSADRDRARVVLREALDRPVEARKLLAGTVRPWVQAIAGYIRAGQASGRHHADVDPEAYVVHMLELVLAATAAAPVTTAGLGDGDAGARTRFDRELARIARASLFTSGAKAPAPPIPDGAASGPKPRAPAEPPPRRKRAR